MKKTILNTGLTVFLSIFVVVPANADDPNGNYQIKSGTVLYNGSALLKDWKGISKSVKGKASCKNAVCDFLVAAPVKSFDSENSNRDHHMIEEVKGAIHKMVVVKASGAKMNPSEKTATANLTVSLGGSEATYPNTQFNLVDEGGSLKIKGKIPCKLSDFKIDPPSLLGVSMSNDIPVEVDLTWSKI